MCSQDTFFILCIYLFDAKLEIMKYKRSFFKKKIKTDLKKLTLFKVCLNIIPWIPFPQYNKCKSDSPCQFCVIFGSFPYEKQSCEQPIWVPRVCVRKWTGVKVVPFSPTSLFEHKTCQEEKGTSVRLMRTTNSYHTCVLEGYRKLFKLLTFTRSSVPVEWQF